MSDDKTPYTAITKVGDLSAMDRMKRALEVHKNWIWGDGIEIAKLRTRMKHLEQDMTDLKAFMNRILTKSGEDYFRPAGSPIAGREPHEQGKTGLRLAGGRRLDL